MLSITKNHTSTKANREFNYLSGAKNNRYYSTANLPRNDYNSKFYAAKMATSTCRLEGKDFPLSTVHSFKSVEKMGEYVMVEKIFSGFSIINKCVKNEALDNLINNSDLIQDPYRDKIEISQEDCNTYIEHANFIKGILTCTLVNNSDKKDTKIPCFLTCDSESDLSFAELLYSIVEAFRHEFSNLGIEIDNSISQDIKKGILKRGETSKGIWCKSTYFDAYETYHKQYPDNFEHIMVCLILLDIKYPGIMTFPEENNYKANLDDHKLLSQYLPKDRKKLTLQDMNPNYFLGLFKALFSSKFMQLMKVYPVPYKNVGELFVKHATQTRLRVIDCKEDIQSLDDGMKLEELFMYDIGDSNLSIAEFLANILCNNIGIVSMALPLDIEIDLYKLYSCMKVISCKGAVVRNIWLLIGNGELYEEIFNDNNLLVFLMLLDIEKPGVIKRKTEGRGILEIGMKTDEVRTTDDTSVASGGDNCNDLKKRKSVSEEGHDHEKTKFLAHMNNKNLREIFENLFKNKFMEVMHAKINSEHDGIGIFLRQANYVKDRVISGKLVVDSNKKVEDIFFLDSNKQNELSAKEFIANTLHRAYKAIEFSFVEKFSSLGIEIDIDKVRDLTTTLNEDSIWQQAIFRAMGYKGIYYKEVFNFENLLAFAIILDVEDPGIIKGKQRQNTPPPEDLVPKAYGGYMDELKKIKQKKT